jgi:DNA-binding NarL/FixJ family response regulator
MRTILLVDDSKVIARLLESLLKSEFKILGHAKDGNEGFQMYQTLKPEVVLLDVTMPNCNGKECLANIMKLNPAAKVIMVSSLSDEATIGECLRLGARGFITKDKISAKDSTSSTNYLLLNIKQILADESVAAA